MTAAFLMSSVPSLVNQKSNHKSSPGAAWEPRSCPSKPACVGGDVFSMQGQRGDGWELCYVPEVLLHCYCCDGGI